MERPCEGVSKREEGRFNPSEEHRSPEGETWAGRSQFTHKSLSSFFPFLGAEVVVVLCSNRRVEMWYCIIDTVLRRD